LDRSHHLAPSSIPFAPARRGARRSFRHVCRRITFAENPHHIAFSPHRFRRARGERRNCRPCRKTGSTRRPGPARRPPPGAGRGLDARCRWRRLPPLLQPGHGRRALRHPRRQRLAPGGDVRRLQHGLEPDRGHAGGVGPVRRHQHRIRGWRHDRRWPLELPHRLQRLRHDLDPRRRHPRLGALLRTGIGAGGILINGQWTYLTDYDDFFAGYTHLTGSDDSILLYAAGIGFGATGTLENGAWEWIGTYDDFSPDWSLQAGTGNTLLLVEADTGLGAGGFLSNGTWEWISEYGDFSTGWAHVSSAGNGHVVFYDAETGLGAWGALDGGEWFFLGTVPGPDASGSGLDALDEESTTDDPVAPSLAPSVVQATPNAAAEAGTSPDGAPAVTLQFLVCPAGTDPATDPGQLVQVCAVEAVERSFILTLDGVSSGETVTGSGTWTTTDLTVYVDLGFAPTSQVRCTSDLGRGCGEGPGHAGARWRFAHNHLASSRNCGVVQLVHLPRMRPQVAQATG
jgi:hypothetical protein